MAEIEVRTPEDLDKVFTDMFRFLQDIYVRLGNIEAEVRRMNTYTPTVTTTPYISPHTGISYGPGSVVLIRPSKLTLRTTGDKSGLVEWLEERDKKETNK